MTSLADLVACGSGADTGSMNFASDAATPATSGADAEQGTGTGADAARSGSDEPTPDSDAGAAADAAHARVADGASGDTLDGNAPERDARSPDAEGPDTKVADAEADAGAFDAGAETGDAASNPCEPGGSGLASDSTGSPTAVDGYGSVDVNGSSTNQIVDFRTTLAVPVEPPGGSGTLFLWPGLQPDGANFDVLNNGVLQPVLTWGPTCAPDAPADSYASWWISGQYVNTYITTSSPNYADYSGCHGGSGMTVGVGDLLAMHMQLQGTDWVQTVNDGPSKQVSYTLDMLGQAQTWAEFVIEQYSRAPTADVVFTSTTITFANAERDACQPTSRGQNDYFSQPLSSSDGRTCCLSRIVLRAQGVAATTPNGP